MPDRKHFDPEQALDRAMLEFWELGWAATSIDTLCAVTGLGRGSLYATFGSKARLFQRCLDRYGDRYERQYDAAVTAHAGDAVAAVRAFFGVTLTRIADPAVPSGCLVAVTLMSLGQLSTVSADRTRQLLDGQRTRLHHALQLGPSVPARVDDLTAQLLGINQSLAVLSRAGAPMTELEAVVRLGTDGLAAALR